MKKEIVLVIVVILLILVCFQLSYIGALAKTSNQNNLQLIRTNQELQKTISDLHETIYAISKRLGVKVPPR